MVCSTSLVHFRTDKRALACVGNVRTRKHPRHTRFEHHPTGAPHIQTRRRKRTDTFEHARHVENLIRTVPILLGCVNNYRSYGMANSHLTWEKYFCNGIQIMPAHNTGKRCPCGDLLRGMSGADHAPTCPKHSSVRTLHHEHLIRHGAMQRAAPGGVGWSPSCVRCRCSLARRHENVCEDAHGDALLAMPEGMLVFDVNKVAAGKSAEVNGAAAAMSEHNKEEQYRHDIHGGTYDWVPVVMESAGRLREGAMRVINMPAKIAADSDGVRCLLAARLAVHHKSICCTTPHTLRICNAIERLRHDIRLYICA